ATTLKYLAIKTRGHGDATGLLKDADGNYAEYPRLRVFKLKQYSRDYSDGKPVIPGAVPFPSLRHLTMDDCPFGDDVVFRGNSASLEYLDFGADEDDVTMFLKQSLFTPTSHPKLQYVKIRCAGGLEPNVFATDTAYYQFLLSIGPDAAARDLPRMTRTCLLST
ncbi:hypothetical protein H4S07_006961, partial [Coemansia furcata]